MPGICAERFLGGFRRALPHWNKRKKKGAPEGAPNVTALSQLCRSSVTACHSYASTSLTLSACDIIFPDLSNA